MGKLFFIALLWCICSTARTQSWTHAGPAQNDPFGNIAIFSLVTDDMGSIYASNYFINGMGIGKWNGETWHQVASVNNSVPYYISYVYSIALDPTGNLYAAGDPDITDPENNTVLKWDGSTWSSVGTGLGNANPFYSIINSIKIDQNGYIYAAGNFTNSNGKRYVAKWDGKTWSELGTGSNALNANDNINVIEIDGVGNIYAAGSFRNSQGNRYVAKWDGTRWSELSNSNNKMFGSYVFSLFADPFGNIYAGGDASTDQSRGFLMKWDGSTWTTPGTLNINGRVYSITGDSAGNIYTGGMFTDSNGYVYVAKWNGSTWSEVGTQNNALRAKGGIYDLKISCAGNLYASGYLTDSSNSIYVAEFPLYAGSCASPQCPIRYTFSYPDTLSICSGHAQQLSVKASDMKLKWYKDGLPWKKDSTSVSANAPGYYKVQLTNCNGLTKFTDSVYVNITDISVSLGHDTTFCEGQLTPFEIRANPGYTNYIWNHTEGTHNTFAIYKSGTYTLTVVNSYGCTATDTIVLQNYCAPFFIPNLITPNNDAKNDTFYVANLLPQCILQVYNLWGEEVYKNVDYNNSWTGENLSDGVYFYILQNSYLRKPWKGWVQIIH